MYHGAPTAAPKGPPLEPALLQEQEAPHQAECCNGASEDPPEGPGGGKGHTNTSGF